RPERVPRSLPSLPGMLSEPPGADPHARWCGRRRGEPGAYPMWEGAGGNASMMPSRKAIAGWHIGGAPLAYLIDVEGRADGCGAVPEMEELGRLAWRPSAAAL
ncbi:MAG: hypothetical protein LC808_34105, partial [Actinobacteria bacterium]|nr:hypothetical protein [Actinomycetota bacterium]